MDLATSEIDQLQAAIGRNQKRIAELQRENRRCRERLAQIDRAIRQERRRTRISEDVATTRADVIRRCAAGESQRSVAKAIGRSPERVRRILAEAEYEARRRDERSAARRALEAKGLAARELLLAMLLETLELTVRSYNGLHNRGARTVGEVVQLSEADLLKTKNLGWKSVREIVDVLGKQGLSLRSDERVGT
jgi:hypothetical protein